MENQHNKKVVLLILDGWGLSAAWNGNAIKLANPANYNYLWQTYPHWALKTFDHTVKFDDQLINSGLGYSIISCGRFLESSFSFIQNKLNRNEITHSKAVVDSIQNCKNNNSALHLCGLLSDNKKISHYQQIFPLVSLAKNLGINSVYLHLILDNDNLNSMSQLAMISEIEKVLDDFGLGRIASISGKNWSQDYNANLERIIQTYRAIAHGDGKVGLDVKQVLQESLERSIECEDIAPTVIMESGKPIGKMNDFDSLIFFNFDDKSLRSLSSIFIGQDKAIRRKEVYNVNVVTFSDYFYLNDNKSYKIAFERNDLKPNLPQLLAENNKNQLYLVPNLKYEHIMHYFLGGDQKISEKVHFRIIPTNDENLGAEILANNLISEIKQQSHDFIVSSFGNCDYAGHNSKIKKVAENVSLVDSYLGEIELACINSGYTLIICSDHGFIEQLANLPTDIKTISHSKNPVPAIIIQKDNAKKAFSNSTVRDQNLSELLTTNHLLTDIAPTILNKFDIAIPDEMTGVSLV